MLSQAEGVWTKSPLREHSGLDEIRNQGETSLTSLKEETQFKKRMKTFTIENPLKDEGKEGMGKRENVHAKGESPEPGPAG